MEHTVMFKPQNNTFYIYSRMISTPTCRASSEKLCEATRALQMENSVPAMEQYVLKIEQDDFI